VDELLAESLSSTVIEDNDLTTIREVSVSQEGASTGTGWVRFGAGPHAGGSVIGGASINGKDAKVDKTSNFARSATHSVHRSAQNSDR
jgi:hypothetical protein